MFKTHFDLFEMLVVAKDIEVKGYEFYNYFYKKTDDKKLKEVFKKLAEDENEHYKTFQRLEEKYKKAGEIDYSYLNDLEVHQYLRHLIQHEIFPELEEIKLDEMNVGDAIKEGIKAEKNSILLYQELIPYNNEKTREVLYRLIKEEKEHFVSLVQFKEKING